MRRTALLTIALLVGVLGANSSAQQKPAGPPPRKTAPSKPTSSSPQPLSPQALKSGMLAKVAQDHLVKSIERHAFETQRDWDAIEIEERRYQEDVDKADAVFKTEITTHGDNGAYHCYLLYQNETVSTQLGRADARLRATATYSEIGDWWSPHDMRLYKYQQALEKVFSAKVYSGECDQNEKMK